MFGTSPGNFKNVDACRLACTAYALEEKKIYKVMTKSGANGVVFRAVALEDMIVAKEENWSIVY